MDKELDFRMAGEMMDKAPERPYTRSASDLQVNYPPSDFSIDYGNTQESAIDWSLGNSKNSDGGFWGGLISGVGSAIFGGGSSGGESSGWSSDIWSGLITAGVGMANNWLQQDTVDQKREFDSGQAQLDRDFKGEQAQLDRDFYAQQNAQKNAVAKEIAALDAKAGIAREGLGATSSLINTRANALGNRAANRTLTTNARTLVEALK